MNINNSSQKILMFTGCVLLVLLSNVGAESDTYSHESNSIEPEKILEAQSKPGIFLSKNKKFQFELSVSGKGGFLVMSTGPVNQ